MDIYLNEEIDNNEELFFKEENVNNEDPINDEKEGVIYENEKINSFTVMEYSEQTVIYQPKPKLTDIIENILSRKSIILYEDIISSYEKENWVSLCLSIDNNNINNNIHNDNSIDSTSSNNNSNIENNNNSINDNNISNQQTENIDNNSINEINNNNKKVYNKHRISFRFKKEPIFENVGGKTKINRRRKLMGENKRKKIKSNFFKVLKNKLKQFKDKKTNKSIFDSKNCFSFPQSMIIDVGKEENKKILKKTLKNVLYDENSKANIEAQIEESASLIKKINKIKTNFINIKDLIPLFNRLRKIKSIVKIDKLTKRIDILEKKESNVKFDELNKIIVKLKEIKYTAENVKLIYEDNKALIDKIDKLKEKNEEINKILNKNIQDIYTNDYLYSEEFEKSIEILIKKGNSYDYIHDYIQVAKGVVNYYMEEKTHKKKKQFLGLKRCKKKFKITKLKK